MQNAERAQVFACVHACLMSASLFTQSGTLIVVQGRAFRGDHKLW